MSHALNHHLQDIVVIKTDFKRSLEAMQKKVDAANSNANKSKQVVDRLVTKVNSKIK